MSERTTTRHANSASGEQHIDRLAATLAYDEAVTKVRLVSPARARVLEKMGIRYVRDLLNHFPRRYIDMSQVEKVSTASIGEMCTVIGVIQDIKLKRPKPRLDLVEIALFDGTGMLMITCFRQAWLMDSLKQGSRIAASGKVEFNYGYKRMTNPFIDVIDERVDEGSGLIIPVHPATEKLSSAWMRRLVENALMLCKGGYDPLPLELRTRYLLPSRSVALACIHFPQAMPEVEMARRRLVYEELLLLELYLMSEAAKRARGRKATAHEVTGTHVKELTRLLPFELSDEQVQARDDLLQVMSAPSTANHLLLGDVGTGKTIVAAFGLAAVADTGTQAMMMAPTEILARQYGEKLGPLLTDAGVTWELLTGSTSPADREAILDRVAAGTVDVLFGTHALLEDDVCMQQCSFVVIDEQHRFGVDQRAQLLSKGEAPDALYLTATPIPRSLALALYGDLSLSYIKYRPQQSGGNTTKVYAKKQRGLAYDAALAALGQGKQVYVVCPLIGSKHESTKEASASEGDQGEDEAYAYATVSIEAEEDFESDNLKEAMKEAEFLASKTFIDYQVELLHGKMSGTEKNEIMNRFRSGETQVLVTTTVIEVGIDVPNASVMIIEDADRFGLAQLHQLRGRVGRGSEPGEVFLISASQAPTALERLEAMERTEDGFELASFDLSLRREGDILGNRQHGASVLKLVNVVRDGSIIEAAHEDAAAILAVDPTLESDAYKTIGREMRVVFRNAGKVEGG